MRELKRMAVGLMLLFMTACSSNGKHRFITVTDPDGVILSVNQGGPRYEQPFYNLEQVLRLGGEEEPTLFNSFIVEMDYAGNWYFTDENRIKKFTPRGDFAGFISRRGEGPGEISYPELASMRDDTLLVRPYRWGSAGRSYFFFHTDGRHIKTVHQPALDIERLKGRSMGVVNLLPGGQFLFFRSDPVPGEEAGMKKWHFGLADTGGRVLKMLDLDITPFSAEVVRGNGGAGRPFLAGARSAVTDRIHILSEAGSRIDVFSLSGDKERVIHLDLPREPVTKAEINEKLERMSRPGHHTILEPGDFPKFKPVVWEVIPDDQGRLWLRKGADMQKRRDITYMIISTEGEYVADQTLPFALHGVKQGLAYGFETTEDDVRVFKACRLVKR